MDVAFIGLGQMGRPMALNMLKSAARVHRLPLAAGSGRGARDAARQARHRAADEGREHRGGHQLLFDINCAAIAEALPMAVKLGIDPEKIGKIVNGGTGSTRAR